MVDLLFESNIDFPVSKGFKLSGGDSNYKTYCYGIQSDWSNFGIPDISVFCCKRIVCLNCSMVVIQP